MPNGVRPEFEWRESDGRIVISAGDLAIVFDQTADRWTHRLELGRIASSPQARAVETDAGRDTAARITSPVYQEVHRHEPVGETGLCCLLTGLVFQHHFSAVVTLSGDAAEPGTLVLAFDLADRCRTQIETLAATYLLNLDSSALADADPHRIVWTGGELGGARLELVASPPTLLALAEAGRQATRVQAVALIEPKSFTHRLCYRWRWTSVSGFTR